jgi:hypothetical protein
MLSGLARVQARCSLRPSPNEAAWIAKFLDLRIRYLKERFPQFRGLQVRVQQYADLVAKGNWRLETVGARATEPAEEH